ncbi:MAG: YdcH family protein [Alphaproteobacteria bacterium]
MNETDPLNRHLSELMAEHRDLDDVISRLTEDGNYNQIQVQRLKKRKLVLKDEITELENRLLPNIIA